MGSSHVSSGNNSDLFGLGEMKILIIAIVSMVLTSCIYLSSETPEGLKTTYYQSGSTKDMIIQDLLNKLDLKIPGE